MAVVTPDAALFGPWLERWALAPDGEAIAGTWAKVLPVRRRDGAPGMLKAGMTTAETAALDLLAWWDGDGAVRLLERGDGAVLMERAAGDRSLAALARAGDDEGPLRILIAAANRLHAARAAPPPHALVPLATRFDGLETVAAAHGGILQRCSDEASLFLATAENERPLHGDLWHDNLLDGGPRGWLAIDPKGFIGERTFDFAIMTTTPDYPGIAGEPDRLIRRAGFVAEKAGLDRSRLLRAILIDAGAYAVWSLSGGHPPDALAIAEIAAAALDA